MYWQLLPRFNCAPCQRHMNQIQLRDLSNVLNDLSLSAGLISIGTGWLLDWNSLMPGQLAQWTEQGTVIWPKQEVKFPVLSDTQQMFSFMGAKKCHLRGRKQGLANETQGLFQWGYPFNHLLRIEGTGKTDGCFSFQFLQRIGLEAMDFRKQFPQVMKCSPCQNKAFFLHRWLAGNLASRCWVMGSHKSANPAFPHPHLFHYHPDECWTWMWLNLNNSLRCLGKKKKQNNTVFEK